MTNYVIATHTPPTIVCPPWCSVTQAEHVAELAQQEGFVIHHSTPGDVQWSACTMPDGTPDPDDPMTLCSYSALDMTIEEAERVAAGILHAIASLRGQTGHIPQQRLAELVAPYTNNGEERA